jgi:hypothetical protein
MAIFKACGGEMTQGISCSPIVRIRIGGVDYRPIRWTDEPEWRYENITFQCGDCATPHGEVHHRIVLLRGVRHALASPSAASATTTPSKTSATSATSATSTTSTTSTCGDRLAHVTPADRRSVVEQTTKDRAARAFF